MSDDDPRDRGINGEVLDSADAPNGGDLSKTLIALVSSYTDRPDLLIAELEKHDPGFVKRMNEASEKDAGEHRTSRFKFGKIQAYAALSVSILAAIALIGAFFYALFLREGFWTLMVIVIFYAVTQGGSSGFDRIIEAVKGLIIQSKDRDGGTRNK